MKWRRYVGIDMQGGEIRAAVLRRRWRKGAQLVETAIQPMPASALVEDLWDLSSSSQKTLGTSLRDALLPLMQTEHRVALSLPDRCGYVMTLDFEKFPRFRGEGKAVIGWQLGKLLPGISDLHFDYQVLRRSPGGTTKLLVVAVPNRILSWYESLFRTVGFLPEYIGFYGLNVYRHWRYRLDPEGDAILIGMNQEGVIVQSYRDGILEYYRSRAVGSQVSGQVQELHRIVAGYGREFSGKGRARFFLHADKPVDAATHETLSECFGRKVQILEGHTDCSPALVAALGAAERMMMGG